MPRQFHKDPETGRSWISYTGVSEVKPVEIVQPMTVTLPPAKNQERRHRCKVCGRRYQTTGVAVIHFNNKHKELFVDKDSWKNYIEVLDIGTVSPDAR